MKVKTKNKAAVTFSPSVSFTFGRERVRDEVFAKAVDVHIERMSDEAIFMSINTDSGEMFGFDFVVGAKDIMDDDGKMARPLCLTVWKTK